jgi:hypothetical protein
MVAETGRALVLSRVALSHCFWTKERVSRLQSLLAEGKSIASIAHVLGAATRDVVASKAWRLGLTGPRQGACKRTWSDGDIAYLRAAWGRQTIAAIAARLGKTPGAVRHRAVYALHLPRERDVGLSAPHPNRAIIKQDKAFCAAMRAAIAAGFEYAPIGIDRRPCTRNPIFVAHGEIGR